MKHFVEDLANFICDNIKGCIAILLIADDVIRLKEVGDKAML